MRNAISKAQKMVAKIKAIESTTVAKDVLKEFRKYICNALYDYDTIVNMCVYIPKLFLVQMMQCMRLLIRI